MNLRSMGYNVDQRMAVLGPQLHEGVPLVHAASAAGVPLRTAQRWLAVYLTRGAAGLRRAQPWYIVIQAAGRPGPGVSDAAVSAIAAYEIPRVGGQSDR